MNIKLRMRLFVRSITNNNEPAKQYFSLIKHKNEYSVVILRLVLSSDFKLYKNSKLLRKYKDKGLFLDSFGIKLKTLSLALREIYREVYLDTNPE